MNYIDIIFIILFAWSAYRGYTTGLIIQVASLAALLLGILGAIKFSGYISEVLIKKFDFTYQHASIIAFVVIFLVIMIAIHLLARIINKLLNIILLETINRVLGVIFGVAKTIFIVSVLLVILNGINKKTQFLPNDTINNSLLYNPVSKIAPAIFPYLHFKGFKNDMENETSVIKIITPKVVRLLC